MSLVPSVQPFKDIEATYVALYRYCFYRLRHAQQAEDVTQEAFLHTFAALPGLPPPHTETLALRAALAKLPDETRELLLLRYANELPVAAIAGLLGVSRFAVYRRCRQALDALRALLEEE